MNVRADSLSDISRCSDEAVAEAALRMKWTNTRAPRNQPRIAKPGTPGPVATSRSRSSGFKPAKLAGGFKRRMLNRRETTAVASANAAMAVKEPRRFQIADINNSAIQIVADAANHAVTGWPRTTLKPHPIMIIATAKITRLSQRAESSILIAPVPLLPFDWRELTISSFCANNILRSPACWSLVDLGDAYLLQQRQIVLDVPIVGDAAVLDLDEVGGDKGDRLALALRLPEPAGEMAAKSHMHSDVVAGHDYLLHRDLEVGHRGAKPARGEGRSFRPLRPARR